VHTKIVESKLSPMTMADTARRDVSGCEYGDARAEKRGYVEGGVPIPGVGAVPFTKISNRLALAAETDLLPLRLRYSTYPADSDYRDPGLDMRSGSEISSKRRKSFRPKSIDPR
jgi:hypothetical protein